MGGVVLNKIDKTFSLYGDSVAQR